MKNQKDETPCVSSTMGQVLSNYVTDSADAITVALSSGKVAVIDWGDYARVSIHDWSAGCINGSWYAMAQEDGKTVYPHRFLMGAERGQIVDHRNGDTLNCRKDNLRITNKFGNAQNRAKSRNKSSTYKGVSRHLGKWAARIVADGKRRHLGRFTSEVEAARAYDVACRELHGEFARPNFPASAPRAEGA